MKKLARKLLLFEIRALALIGASLFLNEAAQAAVPTGHYNHHAKHEKNGDAGKYRPAGIACMDWLLCPLSSPGHGNHAMVGDWGIMAHGLINAVYTIQPRPRGKSGFAAPNHFMVSAERGNLLGGNIRLGLGLSFDAFTEPMGGKPQLFQGGEGAIDLQHKHKMLTNLSVEYRRPFSRNADWFCSLALIGDVSGVPMEFHRPSARRLVDTSPFHHGTTDKHITSSVASCGLDVGKTRVAVAGFHGQEPKADPYSIDLGTPNSIAASFQYLPTDNWAFYLYGARIHNAERHEPDNINRFTAGAMYVRPLEGDDWWATTAIVTHDIKTSASSANMAVIDSTWKFRDRHYLYGRLDIGDKSHEFLEENSFGRPGQAEHETKQNGILDRFQQKNNYLMGAGTVGYAYAFWQSKSTSNSRPNVEAGIGSDVTAHVLPDQLESVYGKLPVSANIYFYMNFDF
ncbi:hypothetical protein L0Y69_00095 [bacterium]|nr:hypothetical protein [bacterium]